MEQSHEHRFVNQLKNNEPDAVKEFVDKYYQRIANILQYKLGRFSATKEDLEDMTIEIIWDILVQIQNNNYDPQKGALSQYIYGVINNTCKNYFKGRKRKITKNFADHLAPHNMNSYEVLDNISSMVAYQQSLEAAKELEIVFAVRRAVKALSTDHQKLIFLKYYERLSYEEISQMENIEIKKVKSRLFEARRKLKSIFLNQKYKPSNL